MEEYKITDEDLDQINKIFKISNSICSLYNQLCQLEIDGKKDTEEYKKVMDYLNITIEVEQEYYNEAKLYSHKCASWIYFIMSNKIPLKLVSNFTSILHSKFELAASRRVLENLISIYINSEEEQLDEGIMQLINDLNISNFMKQDIHLEDYIKFQEYFEKDFLNLFLIYIQGCIDHIDQKKVNDDELRKKFIKTKYYIYSIYTFIEREFLKDNFTSSKFSFIDLDTDFPEFDGMNDEYYSKICLRSMVGLLRKAPSTNFLLFIQYFMFKSSLIFMDKKSIKRVKSVFIDSIKFKTDPKNKIEKYCENLILDSFENIDEYKRSLNLKNTDNNSFTN